MSENGLTRNPLFDNEGSTMAPRRCLCENLNFWEEKGHEGRRFRRKERWVVAF